jgi:hypothetical protein
MAERSHVLQPLRVYGIDKDAVPEAIVIHCSDPRFQGAFEQFLRDELHLDKGRYIPIVVGGGAGVLAHPERLPKEFKFLRDRLEHYVGNVFPTAKRIILVNHQGCRYYQGLKERALPVVDSRKSLTQVAHDDLASVVEIFARLLPHLGATLEAYYARFADGQDDKIVFEKVGAS